MIVFITRNVDTFNNPTIDAILTVLEERKQYSVVICSENKFKNRFKYCRVILYNDSRVKYAFTLKKSIKILVKKIYQFYRFVFLKLTVNTIVAIDPEGLIFALEFKKSIFSKVPVDYLSFEILESQIYENKEKEIAASSQIRNLIIQDNLRDDLIRSENKLNKKIKTFFIPVSPIFVFNYKKNIENFRLIHSIPKEKKMIINFGSLQNWSGANFIYDLLINNCLHSDFVFVIHSRYPLNSEELIHKKLIDYSLKNENLVLSDIYIDSFDDSLQFLKQFDFATAFYFPDKELYTGKNIYNIGLASGKFSMYMKAGLPTFTTDLPTYQKLNAQYNFGFTIKDSNDFRDKLSMNLNKNDHILNCMRLYDELLDPRVNIEDYLNKIK